MNMRARELLENQNNILYHMTETDRVDNILRNGLVPQRTGIRGVTNYSDYSIFLFKGNDNETLSEVATVILFGGKDLEDEGAAETQLTLLRIDLNNMKEFDARNKLNRKWKKDPNMDADAYITNRAIPATAISIDRGIGDEIYERTLAEKALPGTVMYKGRSSNPEKVPSNSFEIRTDELKKNIQGWKNILDKLPDKNAIYAEQVAYRIENMEQDLADFYEIGEIPFTFYATPDEDAARFFADQFTDGVVEKVRIYAKNLATISDLHKVGFISKQSVSHLTPMMIHKLKQAGFDGATGTIDRVSGKEVVVFSPGQVKEL